jgi:lipopolysaccharide transport system permease protein
MIKKVYFPRLAMPIASVLGCALDFVLAFALLLGMVFYYGMAPTVNVVWLPLFLMLAFASSLGVSLWLSALYVKFRDVRHAIPFLTQIWLFATPIAYPSSLLTEPWRTVYGINPMTGVVEGFRWALLGTQMPSESMLIISSFVALVMLISGAFYFRRMERTFADVV